MRSLWLLVLSEVASLEMKNRTQRRSPAPNPSCVMFFPCLTAWREVFREVLSINPHPRMSKCLYVFSFVGGLFMFVCLLCFYIWIFLIRKLTWITFTHTRYSRFNIKLRILGVMNWIQIKIYFARLLHKLFFPSFFPSTIILIIVLGSLLFCPSSYEYGLCCLASPPVLEGAHLLK